MIAVQSATLAARKRLALPNLSVRIEQGRAQIVSVAYDAKGASTITPLSDWFAVGQIVSRLNAL